ncbi:hypothetical protein GCM10027360_22720 [Amycolatopsis echigonensis]
MVRREVVVGRFHLPGEQGRDLEQPSRRRRAGLHQRDPDVPEDLSVIGFDDAPEAERWSLTTVRQPMREKGRLAAEMLHDLLNGQAPAGIVELPAELVVRGTTGPPG